MKSIMHRGHLRLAFFGTMLGVVMLLGSGCVVLPIPTNRLADCSRKDIKPEVINELVVGQTTREDVLLRLGEPDVWSADASQYRYHWERVKWDIFWAVGGEGGAAMGDIPVNKNYNLTVSFDPAGVIAERRFSGKFQESELEKHSPGLQ
jgi:hypothetical protein